MKYIGKTKDEDPYWHIVTHGERHFEVLPYDRVDRRTTWESAIIDQLIRPQEDGFVVIERIKFGNTNWDQVHDPKLRKKIIACSWPMVNE